MREAFTPYRRQDIVALAAAARQKHRGRSIDRVADAEGIVFMRVPDPNGTREGFSCMLTSRVPKKIESSSDDRSMIFSFAEEVEVDYPAIVLNPLCCRHEAEVFWHEYYHLWYSPSRKGAASFYNGYSTEGALDKQEERRANLFAAYVLIPEVQAGDTTQHICDTWGVSPSLAQLRLNSQK